jgi:hypothetical protein
MKLAEALILRKDYKTRIAEITQRLNENVIVQEGDTPSENPATLTAELEEMYDLFTRLIQQINRTNSATHFDDTLSLADAIVLRDMLTQKQAIYRNMATNATTTQTRRRITASELKYRSAIDVPATQKQADGYAKAARELDTKIQSFNWLVDLIE